MNQAAAIQYDACGTRRAAQNVSKLRQTFQPGAFLCKTYWDRVSYGVEPSCKELNGVEGASTRREEPATQITQRNSSQTVDSQRAQAPLGLQPAGTGEKLTSPKSRSSTGRASGENPPNTRTQWRRNLKPSNRKQSAYMITMKTASASQLKINEDPPDGFVASPILRRRPTPQQRQREALNRRIDALRKDIQGRPFVESAISDPITIPVTTVRGNDGWQFEVAFDLDCPATDDRQVFDDPFDAVLFSNVVAGGKSEQLQYLKWVFVADPARLGTVAGAAEKLLLAYFAVSELATLGPNRQRTALERGSETDSIAQLSRDHEGRPVVEPISLFSTTVPIWTIGAKGSEFQVPFDRSETCMSRIFANLGEAREFAFLVANAEAERRRILQNLGH